ncbi:MAG TPA: PEGA domain-containing protein, partial [Polyangiales bacterium]|nr:PEGA domain-containing protein [Polyangiales bacterium]
MLAGWVLGGIGASHVSAQAARAVVVPPHGQEAEGQRGVEAAHALAEALALQGLRVMDFAAAAKQHVEGEACEGRSCAERLLAADAADLAVTLTLWHGPGDEIGRTHVTLLDRAGHRYEGDADVRDSDLRGATTRALLEARALQLLGPGPWLRVEGTPDGAQVKVDGRAVGTLPYRGALAPGRYELQVSADGYIPVKQSVEMPKSDARKVQVRVALQAAPIEAPDSVSAQRAALAGTDRDASRSKLWMAWPVALGGAGLVLAGVTTVRIATASDACVHADSAGRCSERRSVSAAPTVIYYSLSGALIGTAIAWLVLGSSSDEGA